MSAILEEPTTNKTNKTRHTNVLRGNHIYMRLEADEFGVLSEQPSHIKLNMSLSDDHIGPSKIIEDHFSINI
jgi:hypothetical protein